MSPWRARARKVVFRRRTLLMVGQSPLEIGMIIWSAYMIINVIGGQPPSGALQALPLGLEVVWTVLMSIGSLTIFIGLFVERLATVATGMYLFGTTLAAFSVAVIGASGWQRGGAVATLLFIFGFVCLLRGWFLKESETALTKEIVRYTSEDH